jgi:hypothetical protein
MQQSSYAAAMRVAGEGLGWGDSGLSGFGRGRRKADILTGIR